MNETKTKTYQYGMRLRSFSIGCQPMRGLVSAEEDKSGKYHSILTYDRELSEDEVMDYELERIGACDGAT